MTRFHPAAIVAVLAMGSIAVAQSGGGLGAAQEQEQLIGQLENESTKGRAADALVRIGDPSRLLAVLDGRLPGNQPEVLLVLARMREQAEVILPELVRLAPELPSEAWPAFARAVGDLVPYSTIDIGQPVKIATDRLQEELVEQASPELVVEIYNETLRLVGRITEVSIRAQSEVTELVSTLDNSGPDGKILAAELLGYQGSAAQAALPMLRRALLAASHPTARRVDAKAMGASPTPIPPLTRVSLDLEVRTAAASAMERIAPGDAVIALAIAHRLLHDPDVLRRADAAMVLGRFGAEAAEVVPQLVQATADDDLRVVREAITALGMLGPPMREAIPTLRDLTEHEDRQVVGRAQAALRQFDRFEAVARGEAQARNAEEQMHAALFAYGQGWLVSSARLYAQAMTGEQYPPHFAIAAAARAGIEGEGLDDAARVRLRQQALGWIRRGAR